MIKCELCGNLFEATRARQFKSAPAMSIRLLKNLPGAVAVDFFGSDNFILCDVCAGMLKLEYFDALMDRMGKGLGRPCPPEQRQFSIDWLKSLVEIPDRGLMLPAAGQSSAVH